MASPTTSGRGRIRRVAGLVAMLGAVAAALPVLAEERALASEPTGAAGGGGVRAVAPVPEGLLKAYLEQVKQTPVYQLAKLLPENVVRKAAEGWEKEFGLPLRVNPVPEAGGGYSGPITPLTWSTIRSQGAIKMPEPLQPEYAYLGVTPQGQLRLYQSRSSGFAHEPETKSDFIYSVQPAQLRELDFPYADTIEVVDPLLTTLERFTACNEPLNDLLQRLCAAGKVNCSFRQDFVERARITLDLRDKSVLTCLQVLAATAGGRVLYMYPDGQIASNYRPQHFVELADVARTTKQPPADQEQSLAILKKAVAGEVKKTLSDRVVIILQVPAAGEKD